MLTLGQLLQSANQRWRDPSLQQRAADVQINAIKAGFRENWKVPETEFWNYPGVQEILFITQSSQSKTDRRYKKPYRTTFRFPLDPASGQPYAPGTNAQNLPVWVHCSCPAFRFYCEVESTKDGNSDIIDSNGGPYRKNEPTHICKHLYATAKAAMQKRTAIGVTASVATKQKDHAKPLRRNPEKQDIRTTTSGRRTPDVAATSRESNAAVPQTWLGRLLYILFNERAR